MPSDVTAPRLDAPREPIARPIQADLSGEVFAGLINLSGRRRFTSQRLVLYAVLAAHGHSEALDTARDALKLFRDAHLALIEGKNGHPGVFCEELHEAYYGALDGDRIIAEFMALAERVLSALEAGGEVLTWLDELIRSATPLLAVLNQLTLIYEELSQRHSMALRGQARELLGTITAIARQARIVSFNAQIVASSAGQAGRAFSVIATELSGITGEIDKLAREALGNAAS
ncbi:type IV pili methyl-accepting chemotaxis transducer N-terminal domain-containing protein [Halomonas sp. KM-1]|uniref:type IV pili methyl-accepting chemotaxis transducer N-terminal domain-containing protein n=1 Tax=Halomonas sp. KM-1 TaxID=590061 RepID=UPI0002887F2B|nr:type IV pili methyl-accepting chemotaxis transducer N-terminal domain-containing protein [Halomonas sp. KM-1]